MKPEEQIASEFLTRRFGKAPIYEPLGNSTPPDFSMDETAFEIRRLNEQFGENGSNGGLDEIETPFRFALHSELSRIPFSDRGGTVCWEPEFKRPIVKMGKIVKQLVAGARDYYRGDVRKPIEITAGNVTLHLFAAGRPTGKAFRGTFIVDHDSGGMARDLYPTNIRLAVEEKIAKTKAVAEKFDRWILVLVDEIFGGIVEPSEIGPLDLSLAHFNSLAVIGPAGDLALEYPVASLKLHEQIRHRTYEFYEKRGREHGYDFDDWLKAEAELSS